MSSRATARPVDGPLYPSWEEVPAIRGIIPTPRAFSPKPQCRPVVGLGGAWQVAIPISTTSAVRVQCGPGYQEVKLRREIVA